MDLIVAIVMGVLSAWLGSLEWRMKWINQRIDRRVTREDLKDRVDDLKEVITLTLKPVEVKHDDIVRRLDEIVERLK